MQLLSCKALHMALAATVLRDVFVRVDVLGSPSHLGLCPGFGLAIKASPSTISAVCRRDRGLMDGEISEFSYSPKPLSDHRKATCRVFENHQILPAVNFYIAGISKMRAIKSALLLCVALAAKYVLAQDHGEEYSDTMGPVAFMWPPDREWGAAQDNTAPCGSAANIANRTEFPLRR